MIKQAVILAAGEGKRLRPFTETMPKVMLPVANKPIIEYVIEAVKQCGVTEIIIVVGYKKEVIMEYFKDFKNVKITYVFQEKQLGTSHALLQAEKLLDKKFIVLSGDNIINYQSILRLIDNKSDFAILIKEHPQPSKYGVVYIENKKLTSLDCFNLGGSQNLRGFNENQFYGYRIGWLNLEFRYLLSRKSRAFIFSDYGYAESKEYRFGKLFGFGFGLRLETRLGMLGIDYGFGYCNGELRNPIDGIIHFGIESKL